MKWLRNLFGESKPPTADVTATLRKEPGNVYVLRIGGMLNKATTDKIQAVAARDIEAGAQDLKLLLVLRNFRGWKRGDDWGDIEFFARYGEQIARIAVAGDPRWEAETLIFLGSGHRKGEVRYFPLEQEAAARAWLTQ